MHARRLSIGELAKHLGRSVEGDAQFAVEGVAPLEDAGPRDLAFVRGGKAAAGLETSGAGALIAPDGIDVGRRPVIRSPNPGLDFARAVAQLVPRARPEVGVDTSACVAPEAEIHPTASVGPQCAVGARSVVGAGSVLGPNVTLYPDVRVGSDCTIHAGVVLCEGTQIGDRVILHPGAVIGSDGFGYAFDEKGAHEKVPQVGIVVLEDDVEVGANTTIDRATLAETRIRRGTKIDNLVQIGHNCDVGEDVVIVAQSGLAGSTTIERRVIMMARSATAGHITVGEGAFVGARAGVIGNLAAGKRVWGTPATEERTWLRSMAALTRLPDVLRRLRAIEKKLGIRKRDPEQ